MSLPFQTLSCAIASRWCSYRLWAYPSRSLDNSPLLFLLFSPTGTSLGTWLRVLGLFFAILVSLRLVAQSLVLFLFPHIFGFECRLRRPSTISMPGEGNSFGPLESHLLRLCLRNLLLCQLRGGRMFVLLACTREESLLPVWITFFILLLMSLLHTYTVYLMFH